MGYSLYLNNVPSADVLTILRARPDLKIVGVSATNSAVTVLSGQVYLVHTLTDVVRRLLPGIRSRTKPRNA